MFFALIRFLPFIIPFFHLLILKALFYFSNWWYIFMFLLLVIDIGYFILLYLKTKSIKSLLIFFHSLVFVVSGFVFSLLLSTPYVIDLFLIFWSLVYFLYLESVFHYFYRSAKLVIIDLKNVISYINLLIVFFTVASLANLHVFLGWSAWSVSLIFFVSGFVLSMVAFLVNEIKYKPAVIYGFFISFALTEFIVSMFFLPLSFFVLAVCLTVLYYFFGAIAIFYLSAKLTKSIFIQYLFFSVIVVILAMVTASWF